MTLTEFLTNIANAIRGKDGTTATITPADMPARIEAIETGYALEDLGDAEGTTADMLSGKKLYDSHGNVVTGGIDTVGLEFPDIEVSDDGVITATVTQPRGYIDQGSSSSSTHNLTKQAAATITPGTSDQVAVTAGKFTTGDVTVAGDANLVTGNIKSGVSIFGVAGSLESNNIVTEDITITTDMWTNSYKNLTITVSNNISEIVSLDGYFGGTYDNYYEWFIFIASPSVGASPCWFILEDLDSGEASGFATRSRAYTISGNTITLDFGTVVSGNMNNKPLNFTVRIVYKK